MSRVVSVFVGFAFMLVVLLLGMDQKSDIAFQQVSIEDDLSGVLPPGHPSGLLEFQSLNLCAGSQWSLDNGVPSSVYKISINSKTDPSDNPLVIFQKSAINNSFSVIYTTEEGCLSVQSAGRALPFNERHHISIFPNIAIPTNVADVTIVLQDSKSRNLWLSIKTEQDFQKLAAQQWWFIGLYLGTILIYTLAGMAAAIWQKSKLSGTYALYTSIIALWFLQNFGVGSAFIPYWPKEQFFPLMQAFFTGLIVVGVTLICLSFLRLSLRQERILIFAATLDVLLFLSSPFYKNGYAYGALGLALLAIIVFVFLLKGFMKRERAEKLFAIGLMCSVSIGSFQAISVVTGDDFYGFAIFAFPIGNLLESSFWLIAIVEKLWREFERIQVRLLFNATHDPLTKLPNRTFLENRLGKITEEQESKDNCVFFIDLDRFKQINDSLGHATGDIILTMMANRLRTLFPEADTIARFGGDEFCIVLTDITSAEQAKNIGQRIISTLSEPILMLGHELRLFASIGSCMQVEKYSGADAILRNADISVYAAKDLGRANIIVYSEDMHQTALDKFKIEQDIIPGLRRNEFITYFQPIVNLPHGKLAGFEALVRWQHETKGFLPPDRFIEVAENTGLISAISEEVIQQVVDTIGRWKDLGCWQPDCYVSVNISGKQMLDDGLVLLLTALLEDSTVAASDLRVEITESSLVADFDRVAITLSKLQGMGIKILIDDFGTGYSSLKYLHELPIDVLKIDKEFVTGMESSESKRSLIKSIIAMAQSLNLDIVAEGVETEKHRMLLSDYGCNKAQGYFYDKPATSSDIQSRWLSKNGIIDES